MKTKRQNLGRWGEEQAAIFFLEEGYEIIARNVRTPYGEIDLIVRQGDVLVFVEVKTRSNDTYGMPEVSITAKKQEHMLLAAKSYLLDHSELDTAWRIDVVAIRRRGNEPAPEIIHYENALS